MFELFGIVVAFACMGADAWAPRPGNRPLWQDRERMIERPWGPAESVVVGLLAVAAVVALALMGMP